MENTEVFLLNRGAILGGRAGMGGTSDDRITSISSPPNLKSEARLLSRPCRTGVRLISSTLLSYCWLTVTLSSFWTVKVRLEDGVASDCTIVDSLSSLFNSCFERSEEREVCRSSIGSIRSRKGNEMRVLMSFGF